ncbi:hypothetical protein SteCoe_777 [Stentor coeruleus]|uniref:GRAM domain-containing protein n=1 Tax=Stentor coeruleus TaxID=5963 RepID=A0A1R2D386_9CILI|nr:hypothetical protein SteCoe_777 [Stentor coeruleus]
MERKGLQGIFDLSGRKIEENGILFLTSKRLVFLSESVSEISSFEIEIPKARDCLYYKKSGNRVFEGIAEIQDSPSTDCKFSFKYNDTGFRSLVSIFFSISEQIKSGGLYNSNLSMRPTAYSESHGKTLA